MSANDLLNQLEPCQEAAFGWTLACCAHAASLAEDVPQDAYLRVGTGKAGFGGRSALRTWWFGVIRCIARGG